jgi:co-chaperonin GroES (HSP10)
MPDLLVQVPSGPIEPMINPTKDRIVCQLIDKSEDTRVDSLIVHVDRTTESGLGIVEEDTREQILEAKVLAVGPDCRFVRAGQTILLPIYAGYETDIDIEVGPVIITHEPEAMAIVQS